MIEVEGDANRTMVKFDTNQHKDKWKEFLRKMLHTSQECASETSVHGLSYLFKRGRSVPERCLWSAVVALAIVFALFQVPTLYIQWQNDPVITILDTVGHPIEEVEFPAVTICPQGSVYKILESVLFKQFKEYLSNKTSKGYTRAKRSAFSGKAVIPSKNGDGSWLITQKEMMIEVKEFMREVYPGAMEKPTTLIRLMISKEPKETIENEAVLQNEDANQCDPSSNVDIVNTLNKQLNKDLCPDGFQMFEHLGCIHSVQTPMTYNEATRYCNSESGAQLLYLDSYEALQALKEHNITGILSY